MDYSKLHNPYDFANPVSDSDLFVGREHELEEIRYYLDHAVSASRPINIALLGARASGKTSLLNMTEIEAKKRGFCTVRIDLDEDDVKTQLRFFHKIFDGIFSSSCELGAFGGKEGKTFDVYLDIMNAYCIPDDKTFCPFLFPLQYAKAFAAGNSTAPISDDNYKSDLIKLRTEVNRPVVLLFDECNVLAKSRVHLEKLRNIFMNTPGYMLVFTGTQDLFPVMDDVFSPIIRQFKKISVAEFKDEKDTKDCVRKPLEKIGIIPEEIFDFETLKDVKEIHDLSCGRPYEIQLICHILFRRIQTKRAKNMKLELSVLEDVRKELETSQDITSRPILTKIRPFKNKQWAALHLLSACDGYATFDQIWSIEYILKGEKSWTKDALDKEFQYFISEGILKNDDGLLKFAGDDFDRIYTKYFAREQKVNLSFPRLSLEAFWYLKLSKYLTDIKGLKGLTTYVTQVQDVNLYDLAIKLSSEDINVDIFAESPPIVKVLYPLMISYRNDKKMPVAQIKLNLPWLSAQSWYYVENPDNSQPIEDCLSKINLIRERVRKMGGDIFVETREFPITPIELLAHKVENTANEKLKNELFNFHIINLVYEYLNKSNSEEALFHANLAAKYSSAPSPSLGNNLGYFFMAVGDLDKARKFLELAINSSTEAHRSALINYNIGILEAKCSNFNKALTKIDLCIEQIKDASLIKRFCECLFIPRVAGGTVVFDEIKQRPDLLETAIEAKKNLEILQHNK